MAHKTLVNGTAYEISGGRTLVNGTGYSIKGGRTLVNGTGYDVPMSSYLPVFSDNSWADIIEACQTGNVPDDWKVGDQKTMTINGAEYTIDIIGKDHDDYADGSGKAPLTFQMHELYSSRYSMNSSNTNSGGWTSCAMRVSRLPNILLAMPTEIQSAIKEVNKLTSAGNRTATINATADKLFLLSQVEVMGELNYTFEGEGTQYEYYAAGNDRAKTLITEVGKSASKWWLRSPASSNNTSFAYITDAGASFNMTATSTYGITVAFCF